MQSQFMSFYRFTNISMARGVLLKIVNKEYKNEYQQYEQEPTLRKQIQSLGFQLIDNPLTNKVTLNKEFPTAKISIEFRGTPPPLQAKMYKQFSIFYYNEFENHLQLEKIHKKTNPLHKIQNTKTKQKSRLRKEKKNLSQEHFLSIIQFQSKLKKEKLQHLNAIQVLHERNELQVTSLLSQIMYNQSMIFESIKNQFNQLLYKTRSKYRKFLADYPGPEINKLQYTSHNFQLQQSIYTYLESYGINESLNALIEAYSIDKEQRQYMEFLKSIENFLSV